jgi:hypothetical protein
VAPSKETGAFPTERLKLVPAVRQVVGWITVFIAVGVLDSDLLISTNALVPALPEQPGDVNVIRPACAKLPELGVTTQVSFIGPETAKL